MASTENPLQTLDASPYQTISEENVHFMSVMHDLLSVVQSMIKGTASLHPLPVSSNNIANIWRIEGLNFTVTVAYDRDSVSASSEVSEDGAEHDMHPEHLTPDDYAYCSIPLEHKVTNPSSAETDLERTEIQKGLAQSVKSENIQQQLEAFPDQVVATGELPTSCDAEECPDSIICTIPRNSMKMEPGTLTEDGPNDFLDSKNACFAECVYDNPSLDIENNHSKSPGMPVLDQCHPFSKATTINNSDAELRVHQRHFKRRNANVPKRHMSHRTSQRFNGLQQKQSKCQTREQQLYLGDRSALDLDSSTNDGSHFISRDDGDVTPNTTCSFCNKTFAYVSQRIYHESCHTDHRPFKCSFCPRKFSRLFNLKQHERIHTGERPFKCSICHKTFGRSSQLKSHQLAVHMGVKFQCPVCFKMFAYKSDVKRHERVHTILTEGNQ